MNEAMKIITTPPIMIGTIKTVVRILENIKGNPDSERFRCLKLFKERIQVIWDAACTDHRQRM